MTPFGQTLVRTTTTPHHTECGPATTAHNARLRDFDTRNANLTGSIHIIVVFRPLPQTTR